MNHQGLYFNSKIIAEFTYQNLCLQLINLLLLIM